MAADAGSPPADQLIDNETPLELDSEGVFLAARDTNYQHITVCNNAAQVANARNRHHRTLSVTLVRNTTGEYGCDYTIKQRDRDDKRQATP